MILFLVILMTTLYRTKLFAKFCVKNHCTVGFWVRLILLSTMAIVTWWHNLHVFENNRQIIREC